MNNQRYAQSLVLVVACLLLAASLVMAQESEKPPIKLGGAIGVNYASGSYDDTPRGEGIGGFDLDIFRLNADLNYQNLIGRIEYRWYAGYTDYYGTYSMFHTAWLGYDLGDAAPSRLVLYGFPSDRRRMASPAVGSLTSIFMSG